MELTGNLSEFSLPEIFQFLEQGYKKGLLTIRALSADKQWQTYYIWLLQGRIVAAADRLDGQGLLSLIKQRSLVNDQVAANIAQICPNNAPLGLCLKSQGLLQADQLTLLFRTQVLKQVSALLQISNGKFVFDPAASLPQAEMTGLNMPATEVTLMGLRTLQDWSALAEKLPEPTVGIMKVSPATPQIRLESSELLVWNSANGSSLQQIAKKLGLTVEKLQQIAFRLIIANLVEEIFVIEAAPNSVAETPVLEKNLPKPILENFSTSDASKSLATEYSNGANNLRQPIEAFSTSGVSKALSTENHNAGNLSKSIANSNNNPNVSHSFLQNLVGFLRNKL